MVEERDGRSVENAGESGAEPGGRREAAPARPREAGGAGHADAGTESAAAAAEAGAGRLIDDKVWTVRFRAVETMAYADDRAGHFERLARAIQFATVMGGSAVIGGLFAPGWQTAALGAGIAALGAAEIIWGFAARGAAWRRAAEEDRDIHFAAQRLADADGAGADALLKALDAVRTPAEPMLLTLQQVSRNAALRYHDQPLDPVPGRVAWLTRHWLAGRDRAT